MIDYYEILFLVFFRSLTQNFLCFLFADFLNSVFSLLYIVKNLDRFMVAFLKGLFIKAAYILHVVLL